MLIDERRKKLVEAIGFFVTNTKTCGLIKLFKLLYWLDYHHFRETGRDVTGLHYLAYPMGPVPEELYDQFKRKAGDVANQFILEDFKQLVDEYEPPTIDEAPDGLWVPKKRNVPSKIKPKARYAHAYLTKREMRIAEHLAEIFRDVSAADISDISHVKGGPWHKALQSGGERSPIDFTCSLVPMHKGSYLSETDLSDSIQDHEEIKRALS